MSSVTLRQVWDQKDEAQFQEMIVRIAQRIHHCANEEIHEIIANTVALMLLRTMIDGTIERLTEQLELDLGAMPQIVGTRYNLTIVPRKQN